MVWYSDLMKKVNKAISLLLVLGMKGSALYIQARQSYSMRNDCKTIRVLHTEWSEGWGGQEIRIIDEMLLLQNRGVEVYLACKPHSQIAIAARNHVITTFDLSFRGMLDFITLFRLVRLVKKHQIDIINTHSGKDTWLGGVAAKLGRAKFIRTRHLSHPINSSRLNFINEWADHIITTGDTVRNNMIQDNRILPERISSIPTMPDHKKFRQGNYNRAQERERFDLGSNHVAVGIVGVLRRLKRQDLFIEMAGAVHAAHPETRFFIAGDGPQADTLKKLVTQKKLNNIVVFTGHLEDPAGLMAALDIYTQTSSGNMETTTQTVPQALLMGLPVVATDVGSIRQNHVEGNFVLVEPDNVNALTDAVLQLVRDHALRERYAAKARASVESHYSADKMAEKVLRIYHQLLS
jgi:glycosyltransferase involved in cell wall biosynthesis